MDRDQNWACDGWDSSRCEGTPYCPPRCPRFTDRESATALVRPHQPADVDALVEMYLDLGPDARTMGLPPVTESKLRRWLGRFTDDGWSLVAESDDTVVGHTGVTPDNAPAPHLIVFVADEAQGRGIGSELIRQLVAHAADRGHEALSLTVAADNHAAVTVYDNVGFDVIEQLGGELEMRLSLDDPIADRVRRPPSERER
ncbi:MULTISPECIES: GNAT family N-acetyltransferase [Halorubrum]|uniref:GCN5 family acetyltransferase n=1 Tax=Halorubrum tropicale TaxID=1765655 RepID=A0A0M9ANC0_9EURY|nr:MULTISPECIES: GNAT family N-acetyltransferase [Halorubrum]KOX95452.1 GCN5 family acetyltransferase [Halorubrum tropicale]MDB2238991.1 GNAT family N-acetyltransferase [Halorubrum ezzemoulense]MDB2249728.1 GNAT family N-acetyltransferase [Halorubrum ezzemoulense]